MRNLFILLLFITVGYNAGAQQKAIAEQKQPFIINGSFKGLPTGTPIVLERMAFSFIKPVDTAMIAQDGSFKLKDTTSEERLYRIRVTESVNMLAVVKATDKTIKLETDTTRIKLFGYTAEGSPLSGQIRDFVVNSNKQYEMLRYVSAQLQNPHLTDSMKQVLEMQANYFNSMAQNYIQQYLDTVVSPVIGAFGGLSFLDIKNNIQFTTKLEKRLFDKYKNNTLVRDFVMQAEQIKKEMQPVPAFAEGTTPPDITLQDTAGKQSLDLYKLRGKYVLIDFWASWCGPCRAENPNVVAAYNKYKSKGFTVFSISLDTDNNRWKGAIKKDNLTWPNHVSELKGWQSDICKTFKITSIPTNLLLDKEGKVVALNLRGEELENVLANVFKEPAKTAK